MSLLEATTFQIAHLQYHVPQVFQMITEIITTKTNPKQGIFRISRFPPVSSVSFFPAALHPALAGLCLHLLGIYCSSHFYFRASFHLILALSQLCTFSALSSTEVISHYRNYSSHSCARTPEELWDVIAFSSKASSYPALAEEVTGMQTFAKQF